MNTRLCHFLPGRIGSDGWKLAACCAIATSWWVVTGCNEDPTDDASGGTTGGEVACVSCDEGIESNVYAICLGPADEAAGELFDCMCDTGCKDECFDNACQGILPSSECDTCRDDVCSDEVAECRAN